MTRMGWVSLAAVAAAMTAAGAASAQGFELWDQEVTRADGWTTEFGSIDGANYRIDVPDNFSGCLVISNHGYSQTPRNPSRGRVGGRTLLFGEYGCATAASSYSRGGWAIRDAMTDNEKLRGHFLRTYGPTNRVISTGGAMGAATTMTSLELYPHVYDGGLITCCGTMNPTLDAMNESFRMLALFDYYFPGVLPPLDGPLGDFQYGGATDERVIDAFEANPQAAEIFRRTTGRRMEHLANHVTFRWYIVHEAMERAGGMAFDNSTYIYTLDDDQAVVNAGVKRYESDPEAAQYFINWYTPTGELEDPLFIMTPVYDPVVTINNTIGYLDTVRRAGHYDNVTLQWYDHEGHGAVSTEEVEAAFAALWAWMDGGPKPATGKGVTIGERTGGMGIGAPDRVPVFD